MKKALQIWLTDPNRRYDVGLAIYEKIGTADWLKNYFRIGQSLTSFEKLTSEIQTLHDNLPEDSPTDTLPPEGTRTITGEWERIATPKSQPIDYNRLNDRLKKLYSFQKQMFSEMSWRHAAMSQLPPGSEHNPARKEHAVRIDELAECVDWIWLEMDTWVKTKKELPISQQINIQEVMKIQIGQHTKAVERDTDSMSELELKAKESSLMSSRTRMKKKGDTAGVLLKNEELEAVRKALKKCLTS